MRGQAGTFEFGRLLLAAALLILASTARAAPIIENVAPGGLSLAAQNEDPTQTYVFNLQAGATYNNDFAVLNANTTINGNGATLQATEPPNNEKGVLTTVFPLAVNNLTITGTPGIGTIGVPGSGSGIPAVDGGNSSAIREQANGVNTLSLNGVVISGFQMGVLTGSDSGNTHLDQVTVSGSKFVNNGAGFDPAFPNTFGHALYVGDALSLVVQNSLFCGQEIGHDVKSRAASTTVTGSQFYVGTQGPANVAPGLSCNLGSTSNAIDMPNGGTGMVEGDKIFQDFPNGNGSLIRYGEEGLVAGFTNSLDVSNTSFTNFSSAHTGIAIDQPTGCIAPVTGTASDTFTGKLTPVNPASCVSSGSPGPPPVNGVPEPSSGWLLLTALTGGAGLLAVARRWHHRASTRLTRS